MSHRFIGTMYNLLSMKWPIFPKILMRQLNELLVDLSCPVIVITIFNGLNEYSGSKSQCK